MASNRTLLLSAIGFTLFLSTSHASEGKQANRLVIAAPPSSDYVSASGSIHFCADDFSIDLKNNETIYKNISLSRPEEQFYEFSIKGKRDTPIRIHVRKIYNNQKGVFEEEIDKSDKINLRNDENKFIIRQHKTDMTVYGKINYDYTLYYKNNNIEYYIIINGIVHDHDVQNFIKRIKINLYNPDDCKNITLPQYRTH